MRRNAPDPIEAQAQAIAQQHAAEAWRRAYVDRGIWEVEQTVRAGRDASLIDSVYVPVDSLINDVPNAVTFDLEGVRQHTHRGWEVVAAVPRTIGLALMNMDAASLGIAKSYGGGIGGNIAGVHFVLRYAISAANLEASRDTINQYFERQAVRASGG